MSLNTPLSTPTKCGCAGGIVVSCGAEESLRNKPRSKRTKKNSRSISTGQCALCSQEEMQNIRCSVGKSERNRIISDAIDKTDTPQIKTDACGRGREQDAATEKKWYATVIRGALGRWSARGKSRSPSRKEHLRITPGSLSDVPFNSCTNNNSKPTERCEVHNTQDCKNVPRMGTFGIRTTHQSDPDLYGRKLCDKPGSEAKARRSRVFVDNITTQDDCSVKTPPEAASSVRVRRPRGFNGMAKRPKSDSGPRLKLPSLPYRDSEILPKTNINGKEKDKRQRSKKKFLSPIRVKEVSQESQKGQSTYVSFQDDFTKDVHLNVDAQKEIISASASPATQRSGSTSDSPLQVSPTSLTDDVFTENYVNANGKQPIYIHAENDLGSSREELEDARIAKLFQKVNTAFEKDQGTDGTRMMHQAEIRRIWASQRGHAQLDSVTGNATHKVLSPSTKSTKFQGEHIETIMTSANLHASLDNALSMLNESTKLLSPNDSHGWTSGICNSKHQLSGGVLRSRTYSTCSRLEPIAEEIDKSEAVVDELGKDVGDGTGTSCTFSDSSEYEKFNFPNSRVNHYVQQGISSSRVSISSGSSLSNHYWENSLTSGNTSTAPVKDLDPKLKWLISTSRGATRNNSTSTISVRSLHRKRGLMESNVFGPTTAEKCAACEWARRVQFPPTVSVIPYAAWRLIVKDCGGCNERAHFHPWGICGEHHTTPVLCHSHYLQYYQHLQNDQRANRGVRHCLHPSQADSIIDYDIHEVMSDLDDLVVSGTENSSARLHQSTLHHNELCSLNNGQTFASVQSNVRSHIVDVQLGKGPYKHSDTDVSVNCDSAFSTNGSPTPSTRDGINTDRESVGSINDKIEAEEHGFRRMSGLHNDPWVRSDEYIETRCLSSRLQSGDQQNSPRGKRTQSYDDAKSGISPNKRATKHHENRYSLVSSVYSYPSPLTSDDSAVHLQDSASSRSTHLSSDSFYSSGTSFGDKETCLVDGSNDSDALSRSSSEASLQSEGTLCLSEFARSQQNISLFSAPSFPRISDLCSPTRQGNLKQPLPENEVVDQFDDWVNKAKVTESILESFLNSSLAHMQENEASTSVASDSSNDKPPSDTSTIRNTDTLASSSGSSDTNTLGSGSSGSTYATSSLRSYSRFNTLDSSSCVSTDDTGETVVDQYMLRPGGRLHNIEETETTTKNHRLKKKRSYDATRMRYQPSAFHYQNLEAPSFSKNLDALRATSNHAANISFTDREIQMRVSKDVTKTTHITTKRSRSSSMSCVMTSVTKTAACMVRHTKSLPCIYLSHVTDQRSVQKHTQSLNPMDDLSPKPLPQIYGRVLRSKVHSMMRNCSDIDNVIAALMDSLKSTPTIETEKYLDEKLLELSKILKQKDQMINQLHQMLLACSVPERHVGPNHQLNSTM